MMANTIQQWKESLTNYGFEVKTLAIITKDPSKVDYYLKVVDDDLWYYGFGMDLIALDHIDYYRDWPNIGACSKLCSEEFLDQHPIYQILKSIGKESLVEKCRHDDFYDFTKLLTRTRGG
jgi:hypothetical protein